jgi:hypothetical protein
VTVSRSQGGDLRRNGVSPALEPETTAGARGNRAGGGDDHSSVPEGNRPGHHPEVEQDQPDPEAFLARAREVAHRGEHGDADATERPDERTDERIDLTDRARDPSGAGQVVAPSGERGAEDVAAATWAVDPEAVAADPLLVVRSITQASVVQGVRRLAARCTRTAAGVLRRLSDAIDPG